MEKISNFFVKIANWKSLLLFFLINLSFNAYFLPKGFKDKVPEVDKNLPILDLQFGYNPERVKEIVAMYKGAAKEAYIANSTIIDGIYPVVYMFFYAIILSLIFYKWKINPWFKFINLLPFTMVVLDYIENYHIVKMLNTFPENIDSLAVNCSAVTLIKWISAGIILAVILLGLVQNLLKKSRS